MVLHKKRLTKITRNTRSNFIRTGRAIKQGIREVSEANRSRTRRKAPRFSPSRILTVNKRVKAQFKKRKRRASHAVRVNLV